MSKHWVVKMHDGDESLVNENAYQAICQAIDEGVKMVHLGEKMSINVNFIAKIWQVAEEPQNKQVITELTDEERARAQEKAKQVRAKLAQIVTAKSVNI